jgi:hypothetical protein
MNTRLALRLALVFVVGSMLVACGGDDESLVPSTTEAPPSGTGSTVVTSTSSTTSTTSAVLLVSPFVVDPSETAEQMCSRILSREEVDAFVGAPAPFEDIDLNGYVPELGAVICSWSSMDESGLAIETVGVQVYLGEPVPGVEFYSPELFPEIRVVDDMGDEAFFASQGIRRTAEFLDGSVTGIVDYWPFGVVGAEGLATGDDMIALLRIVHERVT